MPSPVDFEDKENFLKVCIPAVIHEGRTQDQAVAQCNNMWAKKEGATLPYPDEAQPKPVGIPDKKSRIDVLGSIKKLIEKSGYAISDEKILEMFGVIEDKKGYLSKLNKKLDSSNDTQEIKVFPKKTVFIEKYKETITFDDKLFNQMILAFNNSKLFKPYMDEDHMLGEKFADILDLLIKDDGLYAKIQLNDKGKDVIKNNIYSYVSPEWGDRTDTDGNIHKNVLWAITLTNIPALEGENPKLQDQIKLTKGGKGMDALNKRLTKLEGKLENYKSQDEAPIMSPELMEAIGMLKEAIAKIDELTQQNQEVVEENETAMAEKEVAEKTAMEYKEKYDTIETEKKEVEKDAFFEKVVSDGQLEAGEVEDWKLQYEKSQDFVTKILTSRPVKSNTQRTTTTLEATGDEVMYNGKKYKLSIADYKIMEQHNFDKTNGKDVDRYIREVLIGTEE